MRGKQHYMLSVDGQEVKLEFTVINDSRRLHEYNTHKKPNLFGVVAAVVCIVDVPKELTPKYWRESDKDTPWSAKGTSFCHWSDEFNAQTGRHRAIKEALLDWSEKYLSSPEDRRIAGKIWLAFVAEEKKRIKVKGPERMPRKPKARQPRIVEVLGRISDQLAEALRPLPPDPEWHRIPYTNMDCESRSESKTKETI